MAQRIPDLMPCIRDGGLGRSTGSAVAAAELGSVGFRRGGADGNDADDMGGRRREESGYIEFLVTSCGSGSNSSGINVE